MTDYKKKYIIVTGFDCEELEKEVNEAIENGWVPVGGGFKDRDDSPAQVLIRPNNNVTD